MSFTAGTRLGRYEIVSMLGAGGMGQVYKARDPILSRDVAVKILPPSMAGDRLWRERFEREARAIAALSHPHVLAVFDVGSADVPYIVTELLEGETLRAVLDRGAMPAPRAIELGLQFLSGLAAAHARGIVHRDLKPENLFVTRENIVKILDFGLAKSTCAASDAAETSANATAAGLILGTVGYMAPEQARGEPSDARADVFAAGAILYEMLSGRRAFQGASPADVLSAVLTEQPRALTLGTGVSAPLAHIVARCLEKRASDRFSTGSELRFALESLSAADTSSVGATSPERSVAVLPFANMSADADSQYFSDGLSEELINALTRLRGLRVTSRTSAFRFRGDTLDIREIARQLAVTHVLEGSVRRSGTRLRVTAQLIDAGDGYHVWSDRYDRELADVFAIQDEIVDAIVKSLAPTLAADAGKVVRRPTENLEAYELYLKGRHYWHQRSPNTLQSALQCFQQVIALDPDYALAHAGIADCYAIYRVYGWYPAASCHEAASAAAARAVASDASLPEVHFSQALVTYYFERHWREALPHVRRALAINPRFSLAQAYLGLMLASEYRFDDAMIPLAEARSLDPFSPLVHYLCAVAAFVAGRFDESVASSRRVLELQPDALLGYWPLSLALSRRHRHDEAIAAGERAVTLSRAPFYVGLLGGAYGLAGRHEQALQLQRELDERQARGEYVSPSTGLMIAVGRNDREGVRAALRRCVDDATPPLTILATCRPELDAARDDMEIDRLLDVVYDGARPLVTPFSSPTSSSNAGSERSWS